MNCGLMIQGYGGKAANALCQTNLPNTGTNLREFVVLGIVLLLCGAIMVWQMRANVNSN